VDHASQHRAGNVVLIRAVVPLGDSPDRSPVQLAVRMSAGRHAEHEVLEDALSLGEDPVDVDELLDGTRLGRATTDGSAAELVYVARVALRERPDAEPLSFAERLLWTTPSRYCPSDRMGGFAERTFRSRDRAEKVHEVTTWVRDFLAYRAGVSDVSTDAAETLLSGAGVCRDFAHVAITLLRALDVPARYVAAYAPGLEPQDFHALVEAHDGERWVLVDATGLSDPRFAVRIGHGRDSADQPFLTLLGGFAPLGLLQVDARLAVG
jgi:transglutaminase-like putative cysteine protease